MIASAETVSEPRATSERPAAEQLSELGVTDEWERRADWLETEAKAQRDAGARARLLLAASEVRALLGSRAEARRLAIAAANHQPAPAFASRQARALHQTHGDISAVARSLVDEARSAVSPNLQAHAHYLAAEIQRLLQRDADAARVSLEAAEQADPNDSRSALQRLVLELSLRQGPPEQRFADADATRELREATVVIQRLRGGEAEGSPVAHADAIALVELQRALGGGRLDDAGGALDTLARQPGFSAAVRWLRTLSRAAHAEQREEALAAYQQLAHDVPGHQARRALAARALGAGNWDVLREALDEAGAAPESSAPESIAPASGLSSPPRSSRPSFSGIERAALAALVGQRPVHDSAPGSLDASLVGSIASAVERASSRPPSPDAPVAPSGAESEFALGRAVATLSSLSDLHVDAESDKPWALVLRLEQSRRQRDLRSLARDLPRLLGQPTAVAECSFVAGVFAETAGDAPAAREAYQASLPSPTTREAATRALSESGNDGAALFRALSAHTTDPLRRALLLTEALYRLEPSAPEFDALAEDAVRTFPELPLALALGEQAARARPDRARTARWLARRRELAVGADDEALALAREASFLMNVDPDAARERFRELSSRDGTLATVLACERLAPPGANARAELRRRLAPSLSPRGRQRFSTEAAIAFEAAGEVEQALSVARDIGGALGALLQARLSTTEGALDELANQWSRLAQRTPDAELASELLGRLGRLERRRGRSARALEWQRQRLALEPASLEALRALDIENMASGREPELEQSSTALFDALEEAAGLGYAFVATRLKIARGAFDEARPIVRRAHASQLPPLWALRLDSVYARDAGDDRTLLATCRTLRERSSQALDAATLSLHAAEAALRLGETALAKDDVQRAGELGPDDIVILSTRAEVLRENGDHAEAAEAFETLASATSSKTRQVDALYQAAVIWLDRLGNRARGMLALQEAASLDVPHAALLERLVALHAQSDDLDGLGELIERQRAPGAGLAAAGSVELSRALDWVEQGRWAEARSILDALLERHPGDAAVLHASAELYVREREWALAERAWQRSLELETKPEVRLAALTGLASVYGEGLADPARQSATLEQMLVLDPGNRALGRQLVALLTRRGERAEAITRQRALLDGASDDAERQADLLALVRLHAGDPSRAEDAAAWLDQARHTWPDDPRVLAAEVAHYESLGESGTARVILERAGQAARAAIEAGRIETAPFITLQATALRLEDTETERVAGATAAALSTGTRSALTGAGPRAARAELDELLAPPLLDGDFRELLLVAGGSIERAYALDPHSLDTTSAPEAITEQVKARCRELGHDRVKVLVSPALGGDCRPLDGEPLTLVLGQALVDRGDTAIVDFLVLRALSLARFNGGALARLTASECWPVLAGFFACFAPPWPATGTDAQRLLYAKNKLRPHVTLVLAADAGMRVAALMPSVLANAQHVGDALLGWATRVALLACGDPAIAFDSLWLAAHPSSPVPKGEEARIRWIAGHPQARDLVSFSVSEPYMTARSRTGVGSTSS